MEASDVYSFAILFWEIWYWKLIADVFDWTIDTDHRQKINDLFLSHKFTPEPFGNINGICSDSLAINPADRPVINSWQDVLEHITNITKNF